MTEKLRNRLGKFLDLSTSDNDSEAASAVQKIMELTGNHYCINSDDKVICVSVRLASGARKDYDYLIRLGMILAAMFRCVGFRQREGAVCKMNFLGYSEDAFAASILFGGFGNLMKGAFRNYEQRLAPESISRDAYVSWHRGFLRGFRDVMRLYLNGIAWAERKAAIPEAVKERARVSHDLITRPDEELSRIAFVAPAYGAGKDTAYLPAVYMNDIRQKRRRCLENG